MWELYLIMFSAPVVLTGIFLAFLIIYCSRKKKNKSLPPEKQYDLTVYSVVLIVTGILAAVFAVSAIVLGFELAQPISIM